MFLKELLLNNSFYYFLKDDTNLDLSKFKDITLAEKKFVRGSFTYENFTSLGDKSRNGTEHLIVLKTNKGSIVFHRNDDVGYIKEFLVGNSKNSPCAFFGVSRDTQVIGFASDSKIDRFVFNSKSNSIVEGQRTPFENKKGFSFGIGKDKSAVKILDNKKEEIGISISDIYEISKSFMGFDIKTTDVEIIDFKIYMYQAISSNVEENVVEEINKNLQKFRAKKIEIFVTCFNKTKPTCYITILNPFNKNEYIYSQKIFDIKNKTEIKNDIYRTLNFAKETDFVFENVDYNLKLLNVFKNKLKHNEIKISINIDNPNNLSVTTPVINSKEIASKKQLKNTLLIDKINDFYFDVIYDYMLKNLLTKREYKFLIKNNLHKKR